jgi:hypothetical protein
LRLDANDKVTYEFLTCFVIIVIEQIEKVGDKVGEKPINQFVSKSWLQAFEKFMALEARIIVIV